MQNDVQQFEPEVEESEEYDGIDERTYVYEDEALFPQYDSEYESFNAFASARNAISYDSTTWNSCFSCDSNSFDNCNLTGGVVECNQGEVCFLEVRSRRGIVSKVEAGCKAESDCNDQKNQNNSQLSTSARLSQCRPQSTHSRFGPSVCRQCYSPCDETLHSGAFCWGKTI